MAKDVEISETVLMTCFPTFVSAWLKIPIGGFRKPCHSGFFYNTRLEGWLDSSSPTMLHLPGASREIGGDQQPLM
jgi:hypothetical protein